MYIKLKTTEENEITVNTSQICWIDEGKVTMSNGLTIHLPEESSKLLYAAIETTAFEYQYDPEDIRPVGASDKTSSLLNDLNKLCGGRGDAKPTTDRKARLKTRLKDFSEEELKLAAKNLGEDEFMQGANESGKRWGTIDYLLRSSASVNKYLEEQPKKKKGMF